ncbi:MAG: nucleotidyl transferase AbiEii/AbiGii toxin family protein, partial [Atribacterota bacterium]
MEKIDPRYLLVKIAKILDKLKIPYFITGGIAVLIWGRPRFTADIDIVVKFKPDKVDKLEKALLALGGSGYVSKDAMKQALKAKGEFNFVDGKTGVKVDFWIIEDSLFNSSQLKRKVIKKVLNQKIYFISPEDLILNKLRWYKKSGSEQQLEDIKS